MTYDALPHRFAGRTAIAEIRAAHEALEAGAESGASYRLAGRVMARRGQGKLVFLDLEDRSGRLQLLAALDVLGEEVLAARRPASRWATWSASRARRSARAAASCRCA